MTMGDSAKVWQMKVVGIGVGFDSEGAFFIAMLLRRSLSSGGLVQKMMTHFGCDAQG